MRASSQSANGWRSRTPAPHVYILASQILDLIRQTFLNGANSNEVLGRREGEERRAVYGVYLTTESMRLRRSAAAPMLLMAMRRKNNDCILLDSYREPCACFSPCGNRSSADGPCVVSGVRSMVCAQLANGLLGNVLGLQATRNHELTAIARQLTTSPDLSSRQFQSCGSGTFLTSISEDKDRTRGRDYSFSLTSCSSVRMSPLL